MVPTPTTEHSFCKKLGQAPTDSTSSDVSIFTATMFMFTFKREITEAMCVKRSCNFNNITNSNNQVAGDHEASLSLCQKIS